uniref:Uncharacterized protein n=1 Tax=Arundo donax TaxID=35708 RepID=A0A0A9AKD9_ARUDO
MSMSSPFSLTEDEALVLHYGLVLYTWLHMS